MTPPTLLTVASPAEVDQAAVLRASVARTHPEWRTVLVLDDGATGRADPAGRAGLGQFDVVSPADQVGGSRVQRWRARYSGEARRLALTVAAAETLLQRPAAGPVVCLEPETLVLGDLSVLVDQLGSAALVPRALGPGPAGASMVEEELSVLRAGTFAPGILTFSPLGLGVARWFLARLDVAAALDDPPGELDPCRLLDLVPSLFEGIVLLRDPGLGVTEVNLPERAVDLSEDGEYVVRGGQPLRSLRFSEPDSTGPARSMMRDPSNTHLVELWRHYLDVLETTRSAGGRPA